MEKVECCCKQGNIAIIEQFTLAEEELRQFVVYTYYNKNEQALYVGKSKDFYNAHSLNSMRFSFWEDIEYVGFVFFKNETEIKEAKKYYVKIRNPKYNKCKYEQLDRLPLGEDDLVIKNKQMLKRWREWLGDEEANCNVCDYKIRS